jgi:hypothetical protein
MIKNNELKFQICKLWKNNSGIEPGFYFVAERKPCIKAKRGLSGKSFLARRINLREDFFLSTTNDPTMANASTNKTAN